MAAGRSAAAALLLGARMRVAGQHALYLSFVSIFWVTVSGFDRVLTALAASGGGRCGGAHLWPAAAGGPPRAPRLLDPGGLVGGSVILSNNLVNTRNVAS